MRARRKRDEILRLILEAVESILREKGFSGLSINQIALRAGVAKSTIYDHYQSRNGLLMAYILKKDYWLPKFEELGEQDKPEGEDLKAFYIRILQQQLEYAFTEKDMQQFVLWQISEENALIRSVCERREEKGATYLDWALPLFKDTSVNFRALNALLVGGIYYLVLHSAVNSSPVCGIDIRRNEHFQEVIKMIEVIMDRMWPEEEVLKN